MTPVMKGVLTMWGFFQRGVDWRSRCSAAMVYAEKRQWEQFVRDAPDRHDSHEWRNGHFIQALEPRRAQIEARPAGAT